MPHFVNGQPPSQRFRDWHLLGKLGGKVAEARFPMFPTRLVAALTNELFEGRAAPALRSPCNPGEILICKRALQVPAQDAHSRSLIEKRNPNVSFKAASPNRCCGKLVRVVAGTHDDPF